MFDIIIGVFTFLISNLGKILGLFGIGLVGDWAIHRFSNTSSGSGGTSGSGHSILGTANLWAYAVIAFAGFGFLDHVVKSRRKR